MKIGGYFKRIIDLPEIAPNYLFLITCYIDNLSNLVLEDFKMVAILSILIAQKAEKACMIENSPYHVMVLNFMDFQIIMISKISVF